MDIDDVPTDHPSSGPPQLTEEVLPGVRLISLHDFLASTQTLSLLDPATPSRISSPSLLEETVLYLLDLRNHRDYMTRRIASNQKLQVVHIPLEELKERRYELPPRHKKFAILLNDYSANNSVISTLQECLGGTHPPPQSPASSQPGQNDDTTPDHPPRKRTKRQGRPQKPWKITGIITAVTSDPHHETWKEARQRNILVEGTENQQSSDDPNHSFVPLPRLWEPDAMVQELLLPTILQAVNHNKTKAGENGLLHGLAKQPSSPQPSPHVHIWDWGAGSGRDVCFLAEQLCANQISPVQLVAMDQRYRKAEKDQEECHFWKRRGVGKHIQCLQIDLNLCPQDCLEDMARQVVASSASEPGQKTILVIFAVRFWVRHIVENFVANRLPTILDGNDVTIIFALSQFGKPSVGAPWTFDHPKEKHVLERSELVDIFKDSPAEWANLHDRVVSDSDHGRTLIQFVAQIEMNDTSRRGEKHVGRKKQVAQKSVHNSQALVIDLLDSDLEDDDNDDEVQVVKQDPESSIGSGNNEQNQGRHSSSNPEQSILSEQSWSDRFSQSSKRKRAAPSRFTVSTKTVEEAKNKTQQSSARSKGPRRLNVGDRVYAEWPKTQSWYWGKIEAINTGREGVTYNVRFDDGDLRKRTARKWISLKEECGPHIEKDPMDKDKTKPKKPSAKSHNSPISKRELGDKDLGTRCYAKHTSGSWYWGTLAMLVGTGPNTDCTVEFDDGEELGGIRMYDEIFTESEMSSFKFSETNRAANLHKSRCRKCSFCRKEDCGNCESCKSNGNSSTIDKCACLFKICLNAKDRGQTIPHFPPGWTFCFEDKTVSDSLHEKLVGFRVKKSGDPSKTYTSVKDAGKAAGLDSFAIESAESEVYKELLGLDIRTDHSQSNPLVGKDWCREWIDPLGSKRSVYGKVSKCEKDYFENDSLIFTITTTSVTHPKPRFGLNRVPESFEQDEGNTQGGVMLWCEKMKRNIPPALGGTVLPKKWFVPETISFETKLGIGNWPSKVLTFRGTKLEFQVRESEIPNAGLGCFLRCTPLMSRPKQESFVLRSGEWLDFGCYAPFRALDSKDTCVLVLKNYIFNFEPERWSFSHLKGDDSKAFDITDEETGTLHIPAKNNILPYVNETDGIETPSVRAEHSPEGSVHYVLGHSDAREGPLAIKYNTWMELKIDYGESYEAVRVKEGYSRLSKTERAKVEETSKNELQNTLRDIFQWSIDEIDKCIHYLLARRIREANQPASRSLIAAIAFYLSLKERADKFEKIEDDEFCDNGWSTMAEKELIPKCRNLVGRLMGLWEFNLGGFSKDILADDASFFMVGRLLNLEKKALEAMHGQELRRRIGKEMGIPLL